LRQLPLGYVGSGLGSAAALIAAARLGRQVSAIALLGGRPDLAGPAVLAAVKASTLLVLGNKGSGGIDLNTQAYQHLQGERSLAAVGGAGHLFEEAGAVAQAAEMAASWFGAHMLEAETA